MVLTFEQKFFLTISRMIAGYISLVASAVIVYKIYLRVQGHRKSLRNGTRSDNEMTTYHRMLLGISIFDIIHSLGAATGTFPVPASSGALFGRGTTATCAVQGFFVQMAATVPVYMACLTTYFMLKIRYNVPDATLNRIYEPWFHAVPILFAFASASIGLVLKLYNPLSIPEMGCWIEQYPIGCGVTEVCTRGYRIGELIDFYRWVLSFAWLFSSFFVVLFNSVMVYSTIRHQEQRNSLYIAARIQKMESSQQKSSGSVTVPQSTGFSSEPELNEASNTNTTEDDETSMHFGMRSPRPLTSTMFNGSISRRLRSATSSGTNRQPVHQVKASRVAGVQCMLYCLASSMTAIWAVLPWAAYKLNAPAAIKVAFAFIFVFVGHFQGVFNLIIFVRLQYNKLREDKTMSRLQCVSYCLTSPASTK